MEDINEGKEKRGQASKERYKCKMKYINEGKEKIGQW